MCFAKSVSLLWGRKTSSHSSFSLPPLSPPRLQIDSALDSRKAAIITQQTEPQSHRAAALKRCHVKAVCSGTKSESDMQLCLTSQNVPSQRNTTRSSSHTYTQRHGDNTQLHVSLSQQKPRSQPSFVDRLWGFYNVIRPGE